jgi:thioredoxin reductase (NADPH)
LDQAGVSYSGIKDKDELVKIIRSAVATSVAESTADATEQAVLSSVRVRNSKTKEEEDIVCAAAFVAIGHDPNTKFVKDQLEMDANGYIITKPGTTRTSVEGVFAAGDVADHVYRQVHSSKIALAARIVFSINLFSTWIKFYVSVR